MRGHKPYCGNQGAVLVIALIMLAVVTFIVIAYLAFAQRDRTSVNMSIIQTENRLLLDAALADAQRNMPELQRKWFHKSSLQSGERRSTHSMSNL